MKLFFTNSQFLLLFLSLILFSNCQKKLYSSESLYYEEKYFRILSNNYDTIEPGTYWTYFNNENSIGFKAKKDFGSLVILKDWSMYNFKLIEIHFKNVCSFIYENIQCQAEMWLYHTKDNGYYPPGRRIYLEQNYFVIVVPFVLAHNKNPAIDSLFKILNLADYVKEEDNNVHISPEKSIKLYQIIQHQPSYLFEGEFKDNSALFMVFTQYHLISVDDYNNLNQKLNQNQFHPLNIISDIYRNMKNEIELKPKITLMAYNDSNYIKLSLIFLFFLISFV